MLSRTLSSCKASSLSVTSFLTLIRFFTTKSAFLKRSFSSSDHLRSGWRIKTFDTSSCLRCACGWAGAVSPEVQSLKYAPLCTVSLLNVPFPGPPCFDLGSPNMVFIRCFTIVCLCRFLSNFSSTLTRTSERRSEIFRFMSRDFGRNPCVILSLLMRSFCRWACMWLRRAWRRERPPKLRFSCLFSSCSTSASNTIMSSSSVISSSFSSMSSMEEGSSLFSSPSDINQPCFDPKMIPPKV
mmetsp:Transcript_35343/g.68708  ORF Transcript_35343/g.68708 Transcript_35343/m.68708 type:complete len:240 (+) Transcript_35343:1368-2087(+)